MSGSLFLRGGTVLTPDGPRKTGVLIRDGRVAALGDELPGDETIECAGAWIGPGFVDLHTHLREPGQEHKETIATGSKAAAAGGYTAVLAMPNTTPALDSAVRVGAVLDRGRDVGLVEVGVAGAVTQDRAGEQLADLDEMLELGVRWFTDDGDSVRTAGLMRAALNIIAPHGGVLSEHAEDATLTKGGIMHAGEVADLLGLPAMPAVAEELIVARDLLLAAEVGGSVHVQHVSTAATVELIAAAKDRGLGITAEATPHHLTFDHSELKSRDPHFKMKPPLRTPADVAAVGEAVRMGIIDVVATDHAPHTVEETTGAGLEASAFGIIGLETAAAAVNTALAMDMTTLFDRMSVTPARLGGFGRHGRLITPGIPANLVVFDPHRNWIPTRFHSKSRNSPFIGRPLTGQVLGTVYEGSFTYRVGAG